MFPAFPIFDGKGNGLYGLTKRELFSAMAMQGILSQPDDTALEINKDEPDAIGAAMARAHRRIANVSVCYADALLAALAPTTTPEVTK